MAPDRTLYPIEVQHILNCVVNLSRLEFNGSGTLYPIEVQHIWNWVVNLSRLESSSSRELNLNAAITCS